MSHRNARLNLRGRELLISRVLDQGWPVAHTAKAQGISRQCAHRWLTRYRTEGAAGLQDRSSRPHTSPTRTSPTRTSPEREQLVLQHRRDHRQGPDRIATALGVPARTCSRVLARHHMPALALLDPITGEQIRTSHDTCTRYQRDKPGELVRIDVKKLGKIPTGGGWRVHGRTATASPRGKRGPIGYDYIHSMVDDCSRLAYSEIHDDEKADTCAGFLIRAAAFFAEHGITEIQRVISDNVLVYRHSRVFAAAVEQIGARQKFIKPHCPWQNGKVERFNRTLAAEWAYTRAWTSNTERREALAPWLKHYNTERPHHALKGHPPITRLS